MKRRRVLANLLAAAVAPVALTALGKFGWGASELFAEGSTTGSLPSEVSSNKPIPGSP